MSAVKIAADEHGIGYSGQQGWIRWCRRGGTATDYMLDDGDGEMGCKDGDKLEKYQQGTTANLRAYRHSGIMGLADKISGEDSGGRAHWRICGTTGMYMVVEEMWDSNRRYVGQYRWRNRLEERRRTGQILIGNDYHRRSDNLGVGETTYLHGN